MTTRTFSDVLRDLFALNGNASGWEVGRASISRAFVTKYDDLWAEYQSLSASSCESDSTPKCVTCHGTGRILQVAVSFNPVADVASSHSFGWKACPRCFGGHPQKFQEAVDKLALRVADREAQRTSPPMLTHCQAGQDGECFSVACPQLRDGEPAKSQRFCPLPHHRYDA